MIPCKASSVKGKKHWIQALETKPQRRWSIVKSLQKSGGDSVIRKRGEMKGRLFLTVSSSFHFRTSPKNFSYHVPFPFQKLKLHRFHVRWSEPHPTHYLSLSEHCRHLYRQNCIFGPKIPLPSISCQSTYMLFEDVQRAPPFFRALYFLVFKRALQGLKMEASEIPNKRYTGKNWHSSKKLQKKQMPSPKGINNRFQGLKYVWLHQATSHFLLSKSLSTCHADGDVVLREMYVPYWMGMYIKRVCILPSPLPRSLGSLWDVSLM